MDPVAAAFKKPKLEEEQACCSINQNQIQTKQTRTQVTQVFLIPQITQSRDFNNVQTKVIESSISDSCDSATTQSIYLETESSDDDKPKSNLVQMASKPHIRFSGTRIQYRKRCFDSISSQDSLPNTKDLCSLLSEKGSCNESGYSSQSASYLKCQPLEKGVENLLNDSEPLVDIENLEMKPPGNSEESGSVSCEKKMRFLRTATALRRSGLMEITIKTADILKQNRIVNKEIERLHQDTLEFLQNVIRNPENKLLQETMAKDCSNQP